MRAEPFLHAQFRLRKPAFALDVELIRAEAGMTVIQGPSGSGKTTVLRCIAGLERTDEAYLQVNGRLWQAPNFCLPTHLRPLGYVFQEDRLFAHLSVAANILFAAPDRKRLSPRLSAVIDVLGIGALLSRRPAELSGGERQRVAIARALAAEPELLLMDEPLTALDAFRRDEVINLLTDLVQLENLSIIYVTHDRSEAARLADHWISIDHGRVVDQTNDAPACGFSPPDASGGGRV